MISERQLARGFAAKWREWAPFLDSAFLSAAASGEVGWARCCRSWEAPMQLAGSHQMNALIAEVAFGLFCECVLSGLPLAGLGMDSREVVLRRAVGRIEVLRRTRLPLAGVVDERLLGEAEQLAARLFRYFDGKEGRIEVQPLLSGVGFLNSCHPDLVFEDAIIEVKMGVSPFRCSDVRQLILYGALLRQSLPRREVGRLCLVNPRRGVAWEFPVEVLVQVISGNSVQDFFDEIVTFLSGEERA